MDIVLQMLIENETISGEEMKEKLQMSRAAIWKRIEKLRQEGYCIQANGKKGYCLVPQFNSLLPAEIKKELNTKWAGQGKIYYKKEMISTNIIAKEMGNEDALHGSFAICEHQTKGRGRFQRQWVDNNGEALMHSLLIRPKMNMQNIQLCTLACALSMAEAISYTYEIEDVKIKWPNDIIVNKKKCAGILSEMSVDLDGIQFIVLGIGVNVNQTEFDEELKDRAISLKIVTGANNLCRRTLLQNYFRNIEKYIDMIENNKIKEFIHLYREASITLQKFVKVSTVNESWVGKAVDVDETGALLVLNEQEELVRVLSGDVSVRGLLDYCD